MAGPTSPNPEPARTRARPVRRRRTLPVAGGDGGSVTAEAAVVLPVLVAVLLAGLWAIGAATARMRCQDAAHEAARALARGEPQAAVTATVARLAPDGAEVSVRREPPLLRVTVRVVLRPLDGVLRLPGLPVAADAVAAEEAAIPPPGAGSPAALPARQGSGSSTAPVRAPGQVRA